MKKLFQNKLVWAVTVLVVITLAAGVFLFGKHKRTPIIIGPEYAEFVAATTSGTISCESTIKVLLVSPFQGDSVTREKVLDGLFDFSPGIKGRARWIDNYTVEFIPSEKLKSGEFYEVTFQLNRVAKVPSKLEELKFSFQVIQQDFDSETELLRTYGNEPSLYKLCGTVYTADVAENTAVEGLLKADLSGTNMFVKWQHEPNRQTHTFVIDSIKRSDVARVLKLNWNGSALSVENLYEQNIRVPALGDFEVLDAVLQSDPEQFITVGFSDPLNTEQILDGMISLDGIDLKFSREGNILKVYPAKHIAGETHKLQVYAGIENYKGKKLPKNYVKEFSFYDEKPEVKLVGNGVILPMADSVIMPFQAIGLKAVDITIIKIYQNNIQQFLQENSFDGRSNLRAVGRPVARKRIDLLRESAANKEGWHLYSINLKEFVKDDPGAIYRVIISFKKDYSLFRCDDKKKLDDLSKTMPEQTENLEDIEPSESDYTEDSYSYYYEEGYDNWWENRDNPCHPAYYNSTRFVSRNIFASNIGLIAKMNANNQLTVVATSITEAKPLSGIEIEVFDYQHQSLGKENTDGDGFVSIACRHKPFIIVAKNGKEFGYLTLKDGEALSLSMFDISGQALQKGLKGFIYGERGVWRPGDTLFLTFVLEDKNNLFPNGHPVIFELTDPRGQLFKRLVKVQNLNGFYTLALATPAEAPTGNWLLTVKAGSAVFTKTLKIETIKPNRLAIELDLGRDSILRGNIAGSVSARWLHGAIASNMKTTVDMKLSAGSTSFSNFPDFEFVDPSADFRAEEQTIFQGALNEAGKASLYYEMGNGKQAPGMLKLSLVTKVFEEGGNFSIDYYTTKYSPFNYYAGISLAQTEGSYGWLYLGRTQKIRIATVDYKGHAVSRSDVKVQLYKLNWNWWWESSDDQTGIYVNSDNLDPVSTETISTRNGYATYDCNVNENGWSATYFIKVTDPDGHSSGQILRFYNPWYSSESGEHPEGAAMLVVNCDKKKYAPGETVHITIPTNERTQALVSIESGTRIISKFWAEAKPSLKNQATIEFEATDEMAPNVFVNVMLLQPYRNTGNDMPLRLYGYAPIMVESPTTRLEPQVNVPAKVGSEETMSITVSEKEGKPMTYTVAVVDEGLLNITRFKAPNPWDYFYAREALGINTWDMYNYLFGGMAGKIEHMFAIGGDQEAASEQNNRTKNRFEPVVKFLGPFELKKGGENKHSIKLPQYSGAIRTMIIAGSKGAYGVAEKTTLVKNPLMVVATLPRVLGPGEEVALPVTIFAEEGDIKNVNLEVNASPLFSIVGSGSQSVSFSGSGNKDVFFKLKVKEATGAANVVVKATSGKYKANYEINIQVRNANDREVRVSENTLGPGKSWQGNINWFGVGGTNKGMIEISNCPPLDLGRRLNYLMQYPHGCIEQTTSSVFPQLYLDGLMYLTSDDKDKTENNIKAGLERLKLFQTSSGAFSYWPGESYVSSWGCTYAGHFLIEASKRGYTLPDGMLNRWVSYQKSQAQSFPTIDGDNSSLSQAYRLMTLALAGESEMGAMNRLKESANLPAQAKWMLAWAYALAGQKEIASALTNNLASDFTSYRETGYTYGSDYRDIALVIPTLCKLNEYDRAWPIAEKVAKTLSSQEWLSTQETAFGLIAMSSIIGSSGRYNDGLNCQISLNGKNEKAETDNRIFRKQFNAEALSGRSYSVSNNGKSIVFVRLVTEGIPMAGNEEETSSNLNLRVRYIDGKGSELDVTRLKQGQDFKAIVTISNPASYLGDYENLALTQIFPSGWEIVNTRVADIVSTGSKNADYQDIRDDRVLTYFSLSRGQSVSFEVQLNASYSGKFYLPAVHVDAMYDNNIFARKQGSWVEVVK